MNFDPACPVPLTIDLPGIGGRIKVQPEDFQVDEVPAYEPCGSGDFLYLQIEKRDLGSEFFTREIGRRLGIDPSDVGMAGMKDRRAVTRQMVSVPMGAEHHLSRLDGDGMRLLGVSRHTNKLRPGHLRGNRFQVLIREAVTDAETRLSKILDRLRQHGMPNYYGSQRFGIGGETHDLGERLIRGEKKSRDGGFLPRGGFLKKLALSAVQSALFNRYLEGRLKDGLLRTVLEGDVLAKLPQGGMFVCSDPSVDQSRFDRREIVTAGPIFGRKTFCAAAVAADREAEVLREAGFAFSDFARFGKLMEGTRRHNLVYVNEIKAESLPEGIQLSFELPAGAYATVLLFEAMKNSALDADENRG